MHLVPGCPARLVLMFVLLHCWMCYEQINDWLIDSDLTLTEWCASPFPEKHGLDLCISEVAWPIFTKLLPHVCLWEKKIKILSRFREFRDFIANISGMQQEIVGRKTACYHSRTRLTYAAPAWRGFTTSSDRQRIDAVLRRANKSGLWKSTFWPSRTCAHQLTKNCS